MQTTTVLGAMMFFPALDFFDEDLIFGQTLNCLRA